MEKGRRIGGLVNYIARRYGKAAEIGIGLFPDVAHALMDKGVRLFACDILPIHHEGITVIVDDITNPDVFLYEGVDLIYSMRPPPELVPHMKRLSGRISADLVVKPLSSDYVMGFLPVRNEDVDFLLWNKACSNETVRSFERQKYGVFR